MSRSVDDLLAEYTGFVNDCRCNAIQGNVHRANGQLNRCCSRVSAFVNSQTSLLNTCYVLPIPGVWANTAHAITTICRQSGDSFAALCSTRYTTSVQHCGT